MDSPPRRGNCHLVAETSLNKCRFPRPGGSPDASVGPEDCLGRGRWLAGPPCSRFVWISMHLLKTDPHQTRRFSGQPTLVTSFRGSAGCLVLAGLAGVGPSAPHARAAPANVRSWRTATCGVLDVPGASRTPQVGQLPRPSGESAGLVWICVHQVHTEPHENGPGGVRAGAEGGPSLRGPARRPPVSRSREARGQGARSGAANPLRARRDLLPGADRPARNPRPGQVRRSRGAA